MEGRKRMSESDSASDERQPPKGDGGRSVAREDELDSKLLFIGNKRYFIDVKENFHGRFIKLAEASALTHPNNNRAPQHQPHYRKSRIILSLPTSATLLTHLDEMLDYLAEHPEKATDLPPPPRNGERAPIPEPIKVIKLVTDDTPDKRTYTIELRENHRGKFVRITMTETGSGMQMHSRGFHSTIQVSDEGLKEIRNALGPLVEKWNKDLPEDKGYKGEMPDTKSFRANGRSYYFDYGQTQRGVFLRLSEVKPTWRTSVSVPRSEWETIRDIFTEACKVVDKDEGGAK